MDGSREHKLIHNVSWADFERRLAAKHDKRVPLFAYLDGTLELMSPSHDHEHIGRVLELLLVQYALEHGIEMSPLGSWTLKNKLKMVGLEPDNCYILATPWRGRRRPDLAIEVGWSRSGIQKLEIYRRFCVPEVWYWRSGAIEIYRLRSSGYVRVEHSRFFPDIDLVHLCTYIDAPQVMRGIRDYRASLAAMRSVTKHAPARRAANRRRVRRR